ncbi:Glycine--tRNA ligase alpha subunit [Weissella viridescens]|uniref:glycine--tRNA ligase n=1 Tax=Weissella viridescens TaxID=1629 RepID=A0A380P9X7_WEIVI|nr:Glycine--tRNA ligase alpha subunit [Weissella viridescens]
MLDARGVVSVTERAKYLSRIRKMAHQVAQEFIDERKKLGFPLLKDEALRAKYLPADEEETNMANYLLEIGLEEVPAHLVTPAINQLVERMENFLTEERLQHGAIKPFSTPRRLAVLVEDVAEKADDFKRKSKDPLRRRP